MRRPPGSAYSSPMLGSGRRCPARGCCSPFCCVWLDRRSCAASVFGFGRGGFARRCSAPTFLYQVDHVGRAVLAIVGHGP
eukprot:8694076-Lingulodinium_polyedra.AAC.1